MSELGIVACGRAGAAVSVRASRFLTDATDRPNCWHTTAYRGSPCDMPRNCSITASSASVHLTMLCTFQLSLSGFRSCLLYWLTLAIASPMGNVVVTRQARVDAQVIVRVEITRGIKRPAFQR